MKGTLAEANVDASIFKDHSSWHAAATAAMAAVISLPHTPTSADWSSPSTFNKFYHCPNFDAQPGQAILGKQNESKQSVRINIIIRGDCPGI